MDNFNLTTFILIDKLGNYPHSNLRICNTLTCTHGTLTCTCSTYTCICSTYTCSGFTCTYKCTTRIYFQIK